MFCKLQIIRFVGKFFGLLALFLSVQLCFFQDQIAIEKQKNDGLTLLLKEHEAELNSIRTLMGLKQNQIVRLFPMECKNVTFAQDQ